MIKKSIKLLIVLVSIFTLVWTNTVCDAAIGPPRYYITVEGTTNGTIEAPYYVQGFDQVNMNITVTPDTGFALGSLSVRRKSYPNPSNEKINYFEKITTSDDEIIFFTLSEDYDSNDSKPAIDIELTEDYKEVYLYIDVQGDRKLYTNNVSPIRLTATSSSGIKIIFWSSTGGSLDLYDKSGSYDPIDNTNNPYFRMATDSYTEILDEDYTGNRSYVKYGKTLFELPVTKVNDNLYLVENIKEDLIVSGTFVKENINPTIELNDNYEYTGNEIKPTIVVKDEDNNVIPKNKYVVTYSNNIEVGTATLTITNVDGQYPRFNKSVNFNIKSPGNIEQIIEDTNYGKALISNEDNLNNIIPLTEEESCERANGKKIYSFIEVSKLEETESIKELFKSKVKDNTKELIYLDVSLFKQVEGQSKVKVTTTADKVKIAIDIPEGIKTTDSVYIIREHDGNVEVIEAKIEGDKLVFETDKFSTYAIGYTAITNPKTGDPIFIFVGVLLLSVVFGVCAIVVFKKKK